MRVQSLTISALLVLSSACSEEMDKAKQAAEAAKGLMKMAEGARKASEAAEKAAAEAEAVAIKDTAGMEPEQAKQQIGLAKSLAAMKAMSEAGGGPAVNWRKLQPYLPDELGDFKATKDLKGATNKMGGMEFTEVSRSYAAGERQLTIKITDAFTAPMLKAPFAMAAMIQEDSTEGYKKGKKIQGHTAIVEWRKSGQRSNVVMLVGERFMLNVTVRPTDTVDDAEKAVALLDLDSLAKLKAEASE